MMAEAISKAASHCLAAAQMPQRTLSTSWWPFIPGEIFSSSAPASV
jgi:hypothetical protein